MAIASLAIASRKVVGLAAVACLLALAGVPRVFAATEAMKAPASATTLTFGGAQYVHRWSKNGQNEFTPPSESDLSRWRDMITINVHEAAKNGDQLADVANRVLSNYQTHGKIVRTDSKPKSPAHPAEHLIVAILGNPEYLEAAFARLVLIGGVGFVIVYSHRVYGKAAGDAMSEWLKTNGPSVEKTLMAWDKLPSLAALKQLPQSK